MNNKIIKWLSYIALILLALVVILYFVLQSSSVQNYIKDKVLISLSEQYKADWSIGDIKIHFFDEIEAQNVVFLDQQQDTLLAADRLNVDIGLFSLLGQEVHIDAIGLVGLRTKIYEVNEGLMNFDFLLPNIDTSNNSVAQKKEGWKFSLDQIDLEYPSILYATSDQSYTADLNSLAIDINNLDLNEQLLDLSSIQLDVAKVVVELKGNESNTSPFSMPDIGWNIDLEELLINESEVSMISGTTTNLSDIHLELTDLSYSDNKIQFDVEQLQTVLKDKIGLSNFAAHLTLMGPVVLVSNLDLATDRDKVSANEILYNLDSETIELENLIAQVSSASLKQLGDYIPNNIKLLDKAGIDVQAKNLLYTGNDFTADELMLSYGKAIVLESSIALGNLLQKNSTIEGRIDHLHTDLLILDRILNDFNIPDSLSRYRDLVVKGSVEGSMSRLNVNEFTMAIDDVFSAKINGALNNLSDLNNLSMEARIDGLKADIQKLPIPTASNVALDSLGVLMFDGNLSGNLRQMSIDGAFQSNLGVLTTDITFDNLDDLDNLLYKGNLSMTQFDLGTLLNNPSLDKISVSTDLEGKGIDFNTVDTKIKGRISDFAFNGYQYDDVNINAVISDSKVNGQLDVDDKNIKLSYDGIIAFRDGQSTYRFVADIDTINLEALGFYKKQVSLSGQIVSDIKLPLRQGSDGYVDVYGLRISNPNESFYEDSLRLVAAKKADSTFIDVRSDFMSFDIDGQFGIRDIPKAIMSFANHHMDTPVLDIKEDPLSKSVSVKGQLKTLIPFDVLMVDKLLQARNISFDLDFDFQQYLGEGQVVADSLFYGEYFSERMNIRMETGEDVLFLDLLGTNNEANGINIPIFSLDNELRNGKLYSTVVAKDDDVLPKLKFSTIIEVAEESLNISLSDSLVLNRKDWMANNDNLIRLIEGKVMINELTLTDQNEYLKIYSADDRGNDLSIDFKNFNIGQFTTLLTNEPSKLSGNIDGEIQIRELTSDMYFLVNTEVKDIVYDSTSVGSLTIKANDNPLTNEVSAEVRLTGPNNDLIGKGTYNTESKDIDFDMNIDNFQLKLLDPFVSEIMKDSQGELSGNVTIDGNIDKPLIDGSVILNKAVTTIVANNARYAIDNHTIRFNNDAIDIGVLDVYDINNNAATISGKIYHSFLDDIILDLQVDTDKFVFLNTSKGDNPIFFGKLVLQANGTIVGPIELLDVNLRARTLENTIVTLSPLSGDSFVIEEGFITYGKPDDYKDQTSEYLLKLARVFPFKVNLLLNASDDATLNFVLDPVTGDRIEGKGKGDLRIKLNPDGQQEIYGTYTVNQGSYKFSYGDFVSKKFKINPGGTVRFNGDPLGAILDIDAIYNVYTTTYELIKNETDDVDEIAAAKKRTNVEVFLSLEGSLSAPKIKLDIQVPELQSSTLISSIDRKLQELRTDANEMNSQVFGLLIFNGFLLSDNASTGFGSIGSNLALSSISNLISNQLNKFADKAIKGVDVNVNVNSYESSYANNDAGGNVTEIGLEVSKRLFNDRLKISAGGNLDLTENGGAESYSSFIGDFVLEYRLTENGNYRVRVFSKSNFDRIANENTNKNGVSLYFNKSFDSKTDTKK